MKKLVFLVAAILISKTSLGSQWVTINPENLDSVQIAQTGNSANQAAGLYIGLQNDITGEAATYCSRKDFLVITDPGFVDRAYSIELLAISTSRTFKLLADAQGNCAYNGPVATILTLVP